MPATKQAFSPSSPVSTHSARRLTPVSEPKLYEELDGAVGREVFFRPTRYRSQDLAPLSAVVQVRIAGRSTQCVLVDVSQGGIAIEWPAGEIPAVGEVVEELLLALDGHTVYRGGARLASVRSVDARWVVGASLTDMLIHVDDVLQLRDVKQWQLERRAVQTPVWASPGHAAFKAEIAELRLFLDDAADHLGQLEGDLPFHVVHGEADVLARHGLQDYVRSDFTPEFLARTHRIDALVREATAAEVPRLKELSARFLQDLFLQAPWMLRARTKPLFYPGDYEVMNFIYGRHFEGRTLFGKALNYASLQSPAAEAVRGRKDMIKGQLRAAVRDWALPRPIRILSVAAGPAQEVFELLGDLEDTRAGIEIILFDQDNGALAFAYGRIRRLVEQRWPGRVKVTFLHDSIKRLLKEPQMFDAFGTFDVIVCAGLYDYLPVPTAVVLTRTLWNLLQPGGTTYIGNMAPENPSRWIMEHHLDWYLLHRTRDEMRAFAEVAAPEAELRILEERTGVNPFIALRKV